jgi:hypothetical protein
MVNIGCQKLDSGCNRRTGIDNIPQKFLKNCGPFCGPSSVHSGPLAVLRAGDQNPESRTIKRNSLTSLNENGCQGDSRRLHYFSISAQRSGALHAPDFCRAMHGIARFVLRFRAFSIREKWEGMAPFVTRHDHFLNRNHPVFARIFESRRRFTRRMLPILRATAGKLSSSTTRMSGIISTRS